MKSYISGTEGKSYFSFSERIFLCPNKSLSFFILKRSFIFYGYIDSTSVILFLFSVYLGGLILGSTDILMWDSSCTE